MPIEAHLLVYVAEEQGFFGKNGLNVTIRDYSTGPAAMEGLLNGEVDVSHSGEFVAVENALGKSDFKIITSIDKYQFFYLAGRKDRGIMVKRLQLEDSYIESIWQDHRFGLSLDQSLIAAMEDEARWMIANNLTTEKQVPNFNNYIYEDALNAIKPEAVNIIR